MRFQALYIFDYLLTLQYEAKYFWNKRFSAASALFYLSRYLLLGDSLNTIASYYVFHLHGQVCRSSSLVKRY